MSRVWTDCGANPASQHAAGRKARRVLEEAREGIGELLGAKTGGMDADQVVFTSGGTEANNLALFGLSETVAISAIDHPSVTAAAEELRRTGQNVAVLPVDEQGIVRLHGLDAGGQGLVSVMLANNETGVIQPVGEIASIWSGHGKVFHTDAVQAVGKIPVNFRELGVDAMTVAPHKFHGPLGIGALVLRHEMKIRPRLFGGFQQAAARPGTESVALAAGFHASLRIAISELSDRAARMQTLRDEFEQQLVGDLQPLVIIGQSSPRLPNTSCISFPGLDRQALVMALDLSGVACSTGSACASGSSEPSPTLVAMGLAQDVIDGAIRFSLSAFTTAAEMAEASRRIIKTVKHLRAGK